MNKKFRKIFNQSEGAILKFRIWRQKRSQMKAYDPMILKLALNLKSIKNFSSNRSLKISNFGIFQKFWRKSDFSRDTGMPAHFNYIQMKAYKKLHQIYIGRSNMRQRNKVKN